MSRLSRFIAIGLILLFGFLLCLGWQGFRDARLQSAEYRARADQLIADGQGPSGLGEGRFEDIVTVQDPYFAGHGGVDFATKGAGATTISQSLAKRLGFEEFSPGLGKIRQTGFALGLETTLTKRQIAALWLDTLEIGRGPDGWMTGIFEASETLYGEPPCDLTETEFLRLVAVLIAPGRFDLLSDDPQLEQRVSRIERLLQGDCAPKSHGDVWLEDCGTVSEASFPGGIVLKQ